MIAAAGSSPPECRKKGRFELTGCAVEKLEASPHATLRSVSPVPPPPSTSQPTTISATSGTPDHQQQMSQMVYGHMEALLKQTEMQRVMLHDLLFGLSNGALRPHMVSLPRSRSSSIDFQQKTTMTSPPLPSSLSLMEQRWNGLQQFTDVAAKSPPSSVPAPVSTPPAQNEITSAMVSPAICINILFLRLIVFF